MTPSRKIPLDIQNQIRQRAKYLCEYCHTSELWQYVRFTVDYIIPISQSGADSFENLCLACFHCNRRKSDKTSGFDSLTNDIVSLYHPRKHLWNEHFIWSYDKLYIIGTSPIGRVTEKTLEFNRERAIRIRKEDIIVDRHPPREDNINANKT